MQQVNIKPVCNNIKPALLSGLDVDDYKNACLYTNKLYWFEKNKVRECVYISAVCLSKKLGEKSCLTVDSYYIYDVFNTYQHGIDYNNQFILIEQGNKRDE